MPKKCWVCKNTEEFFLAKKTELLQNIQKQIEECENIESNIKEITIQKLGFTDEAKEKVKAIGKVYAEMTFSAILENKNNFVQLEPSIEILLNYHDKYFLRNIKTLNEVIEKYLQEPIEERYLYDLNENTRKKNNLIEKKGKIQEINTFFIEKYISSRYIDTKLSELAKEPVDYSSYGYSYSTFHSSKNKDKNALTFSFSDLGFDIKKKIFICPICLSLFAESASSSFEIKEAQRKAIQDSYNDDWDDDD